MTAPPDQPLASPTPSALEDERDFLLRSLEDLEREHEVGDVDDHDYEALKDDYTARAAQVLRTLEADQVPTPRRRSRSWRRTALVALAVAVFAGSAGLLVAQTSGRRDAGELGSGDIRRSVTEKLNEAGRLLAEGDDDGAIALYDEVLVDQPTNAEALAYKGWAHYILGSDPESGLTFLIDAATADPSYPDAHAFLAVALYRSGLVEQAGRELDRLEALDPPPGLLELTAGLRAQVDAALGSTTTTTAP